MRAEPVPTFSGGAVRGTAEPLTSSGALSGLLGRFHVRRLDWLLRQGNFAALVVAIRCSSISSSRD
eukprot:3354480-Pyramimonas_sp.AAC.1